MAAICCRKKIKAGIHQKYHRQFFGRPQTPACSAWRALLKEAAVREAIVSPAGPSTVTMKLTGARRRRCRAPRRPRERRPSRRRMGEAVERGVPRRDLFQAQERQGHGLVSRSALARRSGSPRLHRSSTADAGSRLSGRSNLWNGDGTNSDPGHSCTALPDPFPHPPSPGPGKCGSPASQAGLFFFDRAAMLIGDLHGFRWVRPRWDRLAARRSLPTFRKPRARMLADHMRPVTAPPRTACEITRPCIGLGRARFSELENTRA